MAEWPSGTSRLLSQQSSRRASRFCSLFCLHRHRKSVKSCLSMPNIRNKLTIGIELEGVVQTPEAPTIATARGFQRHFDSSVVNDDGQESPAGRGFEYVTQILPVDVSMSNVGENLVFTNPGDLHRSTIDALCQCIGHVNSSCGVHVHLGRPASQSDVNVSKWEPERVRTFLAIGLLLESRIFDAVPNSRSDSRACARIGARYSRNDLVQFYPTGAVRARKYDNEKRYCWLNLIETRRVGTDSTPGRGSSQALGTIEVRALGSTKNVDYIMAWVELWLNIAAYVAYLPSSLAIMQCVHADNRIPRLLAKLNKFAVDTKEVVVSRAQTAWSPCPPIVQSSQS